MFFEVTQLSNRRLNAESSLAIQKKISPLLPVDIIIKSPLSIIKLNEDDGKKILKLYFFLIMKSDQTFLDLRPKHFMSEKSETVSNLLWDPGNLWAEFDPSFLFGLRDIYTGYYRHNDDLFSQGLEACGLIKANWDNAQKKEVEAVFLKHFSNGRTDEISFDLNVFKNSFAEIFKTLVKNKITLDKNFLYLGIMLISLYITMNEIGGKYKISEIVLNDL